MPHPSSETLSLYHDGELAPDQADGVEAHLVGCAPCRLELAELERFSAAFAASARLKLSQSARSRIYDSLTLPVWIRMVLPMARPFAAAASLLIATGIPILMMSGSASTAGASPSGPTSWETAAVARDSEASASLVGPQSQYAEWVVADLSARNQK